ncbi:MAG TPA: hypothetical protein ENL03_01035, partial [Phycisphaerae bacterium]|nr:hypothetical protein [Phycisphaerae bacterium]
MIEKLSANKRLAAAARAIKPGKAVTLSGVWGSSTPLIAATLAKLNRAPLLMITSHLDDADDTVDDLELFTNASAKLIPAWETDLGAQYVSDEVTVERLELCSDLANRKNKTQGFDRPLQLVAPIMALLQAVPSEKALADGKLTLQRGANIDPDNLTAWLFDAGYEKVDQVDQQGHCARRGGIIDILPPGGD